MRALQYFALTFIMPVLSIAQELKPVPAEPQSADAAIDLIGNISMAIKNGQYLLAGAFLTLILVFIIKKYVLPKAKLGPGVLPIVSTILGMLVGSAVAIIGGASAQQAMLAVLAGPMAGNVWDSAAKFFFKKS
jgi:hypothetical protein